jgi:hypothetical protein
MTNDIYRSSYRHLDIEPGSTWQEVRRAYKRSVKKWHPDHFHHDSKTQSIAAEKIKEINCAFDLLAEHYRTHGSLPLPGVPSATPSPETSSAPPQDTHRPSGRPRPPTDHATAGAGERNTSSSEEVKKRGGIVTRLVLVVFAGWLGYTLWHAPAVAPEASAPKRNEPAGNPEAQTEDAGKTQTEPEQPVRYFSYGSTIGDVYAIQGIPTKTTDGIWYYGKSIIHFHDGKVASWEDNPANPLKASAEAAVNRTAETVFGRGSTKIQVRAVQGEPLREWANVWEYGTSKVYFDGDRVSGWYDSTLDPLRVRK